MEHFLHISGDILRVLMAVVTDTAAAIVDEIVVALDTLGRTVISVIEAHRDQRLFSGALIAVALGQQQQGRGEADAAHCKWPDGAPAHAGVSGSARARQNNSASSAEP